MSSNLLYRWKLITISLDGGMDTVGNHRETGQETGSRQNERETADRESAVGGSEKQTLGQSERETADKESAGGGWEIETSSQSEWESSQSESETASRERTLDGWNRKTSGQSKRETAGREKAGDGWGRQTGVSTTEAPEGVEDIEDKEERKDGCRRSTQRQQELSKVFDMVIVKEESDANVSEGVTDKADIQPVWNGRESDTGQSDVILTGTERSLIETHVKGSDSKEGQSDADALEAEGCALTNEMYTENDPLEVAQPNIYIHLLDRSPNDLMRAQIEKYIEENNTEKLAKVFLKISCQRGWLQYMHALMPLFNDPVTGLQGVDKKFQNFVQAVERCLQQDLKQDNLKALTIIGVHLMISCHGNGQWQEAFLLLSYMNFRLMDVLRAEMRRVQPIQLLTMVVQICIAVDTIGGISEALQLSRWYESDCINPKIARLCCSTKLCCLKQVCALLVRAIKNDNIKSTLSQIASFRIMADIAMKLASSQASDKMLLKRKYGELIVLNDVYNALLKLAIQVELPDITIMLFNLIYNFCGELQSSPDLLRKLIMFLYRKSAPTNKLFDKAVAVAWYCTWRNIGLYPIQPMREKNAVTIVLWTCLSREEMGLLVYRHLKDCACDALSPESKHSITILLKPRPPDQINDLFQEVNSDLGVACIRLEIVLRCDLEPPLLFDRKEHVGKYQLNPASVATFIKTLKSETSHNNGHIREKDHTTPLDNNNNLQCHDSRRVVYCGDTSGVGDSPEVESYQHHTPLRFRVPTHSIRPLPYPSVSKAIASSSKQQHSMALPVSSELKHNDRMKISKLCGLPYLRFRSGDVQTSTMGTADSRCSSLQTDGTDLEKKHAVFSEQPGRYATTNGHQYNHHLSPGVAKYSSVPLIPDSVGRASFQGDNTRIN